MIEDEYLIFEPHQEIRTTWVPLEEYERLQAENERLAGELAKLRAASQRDQDAYYERALSHHAVEQRLARELALVKAAAREFLTMSTNITRAALAEAVKEEAP